MRPKDEGSILPLTIFFAVFALAVVIVVTAATSLYLERKRLLSVADGAALVGAEAFDLDQVSLGEGGAPFVTVTDADVAAAVAEYLDGQPRSEFEGMRVERAESIDGRSATVVLSSYWRPPVVGMLLPEGLRIEVQSTARSVFS
jgi:uncharacterized membrane protein